MNGIKRTLSTEDNENNSTPNNSPDSKKLRHDSSHSENDDETQLIDSQTDLLNDDHSTSQSETEGEEVEDNHIESNFSDYSIPHIDFDNGENDPFRYDGEIIFHIHIPSRLRYQELSSEPTKIRTIAWTLTAFIRPMNENFQNDSLGTFGLFIKCNIDKSVQNWSIFAKAELTLLHATDSNKNFIKKTNHLFNSRSDDWGYHSFKTLREMYSDFIHPSDNTIRIHAKIHADPPRNIEWDSKTQTGYAGLRNIGATCYMNSFLQTIYFTKKLRKAVYALPTEHDDQLRSISLALQKLFYDLQFTDRIISTKRLTRSFGWDKPDEFCQHDIQEFCRVLLDKLESKMEGTTMEGIIPTLYQGQCVQYVRCTKVDHESRVIQTFYDVPLQVRNNANVIESFRDFCKQETLTGENLYDAGNIYGLQEAEKGVKFLKFPPVLCLHLLRFEYDYNLLQNRKINDSYSFDYHLDLSEFLEKPDCSPCSYKLLSILVHSGDNSSGHYVSFINPQLDEQWFRFDDDVVAHVSSNDAMERNFGGTRDDDGSMYNTSAYMLVYIREDCQNDVLCDINLEDIPENLIKRFDYEKTMSPKRRMNSAENGTFELQIILNDDFYIRPTSSLMELIHDNPIDYLQTRRLLRYIKVQRSELFRTFAKRLAYEMGVNLDEDIRIWFVNTHELHVNHHYHSPTLLTYTLLHCDDYDKKMLDLFQDDISGRRTLPIYVEQKICLNGTYQLLPYDKDNDILIFVRLYNSRDESLLYIGHFIFPQQQTFQKCLNDIAVRIKLPISSSTTYLVHQNVTKHHQISQYESIKSSNFDLPLSQVLHPCLSGVSLIIQILDPNQIANENCSTTTVDDYFSNLENRQEFDIYNRDNTRSECLFKLYLPLKTSIKEIIRLISERIEYSEQQIIIQKPSNSMSITNITPSILSLHIGNEQKLRDLFPSTRVNVPSPRKIFFKRLPFNYTELEHRRLFRIFITNTIKKDQQREVHLYARNSSTIKDFLDEIKQWIPTICSENSNQQLRLTELILCNPINPPFELRICSDQSRIDEFNNLTNRFYHLEEIIPDENDQNKDMVLIPVAHYIKENIIQINHQNFFPFFLNVIHNETFADVKHRLQIKLGLSNRELEKYRFSIFNGNKIISRCDDNMGRINLRELKSIQKTCWLGLELPIISNPRKTRKSLFSEKPIRIN